MNTKDQVKAARGFFALAQYHFNLIEGLQRKAQKRPEPIKRKAMLLPQWLKRLFSRR